ncbi:DNA-binding protein Fis [hydrothermal vent metagenome]|uniref:Putative Fis-like DNA-binding protein n=1 Tax=hydrothermal vent metagenome TaxID=652676 RepID=A0A3B0XBJ7_9ZZZZ
MNNSNVINLPNIRNEAQSTGLNNAIRTSLSQFLDDLDGENPGNIYDMVLQQVEAPLLELILQHVDGNQSKAADYLGINRGTLRKKLKAYQLIE